MNSLANIVFRLLYRQDKNIQQYLNLNEVFYTAFYYDFMKKLEKYWFYDNTPP